jgi:hypothetical protein
MWIRRSSPFRGLLAGLVALTVFASSALGMTSGASISVAQVASLPQTLTAQVFAPHDGHGGGHHR